MPVEGKWSGLKVGEAMKACAERWQDSLPARVFAPDPRVERTWERCAFHILSAMECGLPRIGAVNYPVFWMRDCVIVLRALDLMGRGDLARTGCEYLAPLCFSGGFGAESDAPGQGIWALVNHSRMSADRDWLRAAFPHVRERIRWLERMLAADRPIYLPGESRTPHAMRMPDSAILCFGAENGLIHGRMDWHSPDFYINCWARCGFAMAADAAQELGEPDLAAAWRARASLLDAAIARYLLPSYGNDRDPAVAPYPTGTLASWPDALRDAFGAWYRGHRLNAEGDRKPEELWSYFEAAQIHNAILLGLRKEAWVNLDGMLQRTGRWDVSAYPEGQPGGGEYLPYRNDAGARGWLDRESALGGNMPHNWTSAEMINLIRDLFVCERNGRLVFGLGVPEAWLKPGSRFGVRKMPTEFGPVTYTVTIRPDGSPVVRCTDELDFELGFGA